ncbi:MAG: STAS domain-containing protein [Planctomycetota bacterium]
MSQELHARFEGADSNILVIEVPTELTHVNSEDLRGEVHSRMPDHDRAAVVLDLSGCRLITSIGVAALLQIREACLDSHSTLLLAALNSELVEFFQMLRLFDLFQIVESVDDAIDRVAG